MDSFSIRWLVVVVLAFILIYFIRQVRQPNSPYNAALRDSGPGSAYSFSKSQLLWWTVLVSLCFAISYAHTGVAEGVLNPSTLILLGISLGTTASGRVIDNGDASNPSVLRHQNNARHSFLTDILSDHDGICLHRFQALIFNVIFGAVFVIQFFADDMGVLPEFDNTTLGLLGLSSGGYLTLKMNENTETKTKEVVARANTPTAVTPSPLPPTTPPANTPTDTTTNPPAS